MIEFTEFIARRKAWQIFVLLVIPMFATQFYLVGNMPSPTSSPQPPGMEEIATLFRAAMLMSLLMMILLLTWVVSIGFAANRRVVPNLRKNTRFAIACVVYAVSYIALATFIFPRPGSLSSVGESIGLVVPLHLLSMVALLYVFVFSARSILMAERQSAVSFFDYSGPFFLMWFFPIGVWFVQPRVNRLVPDRGC